MSNYIFYLAVLIVIIVIFKHYLKLSAGWCKSQRCMVGKTAIVTGANSGIGFETAADFAKRGAKVILACRDDERGEAAKLRIIEKSDNPNIFVKIIDMRSFKSVRAFAKEINENENRLDILVNNAGVAPDSVEKTEDGHYLGMQVNYFSMFLLTHLLLGLLQKTGSSRVVNTSSILARFVLNFDVKKLCRDLGNFGMYSWSKLYIILFTKELAKRLAKTTITTYSLHPGAVKTDIFRHCTGVYYVIFTPIQNWFSKSWKSGAQTTIHCSVEKNIEHLSGQHFEDCGRVPDYFPTVRGFKGADRLWELTEQIVGLKEEEKLV